MTAVATLQGLGEVGASSRNQTLQSQPPAPDETTAALEQGLQLPQGTQLVPPIPYSVPGLQPVACTFCLALLLRCHCQTIENPTCEGVVQTGASEVVGLNIGAGRP